MPFVSVGNSSVQYEVDGQGPGLVLVHGTGGDAERVFGNVVHLFRDRHTVIRPNFSGSGQTIDPGGPLTVDLLADQVMGAARAVSKEPVDLLGFSLGAVVVAAAAAAYPEWVRTLTLVGGWAHSTGPRDHVYFETWGKLLATDRELFKRFSTLTGFSASAIDAFGHEGLAQSLANDWPPPGIARQIELGGRVDIRDRLPKIQAPTLIIGLASDHMIPIDGSRQLHAGIRGSRLVELEQEGHMDWFGHPDAIAKLVRELIA